MSTNDVKISPNLWKMNPGAQQKTMLKNIPQQIEKCSKHDSTNGSPKNTDTQKTQNNHAKTKAKNALKKTTIPKSKIWDRRQPTYFWGAGKTSHSEKSIAKHPVKHTFCNIAKTRAVRRREFLRDMVSQGRPHPLRHSFKVLRSDSAKRFIWT